MRAEIGLADRLPARRFVMASAFAAALANGAVHLVGPDPDLVVVLRVLSGACSLGVGFLFGGPSWLLIPLCLLWGLSVVADSPQFSSCVIELSAPEHVGTMQTIQTSIGFLLTLATIHLVPPLVEALGWRYAFAPLALGHLFGVLAMARLRADPAAVKLAGGRG